MAGINLKTYVDETDRFSISYPEDWVFEKGDDNSSVIFSRKSNKMVDKMSLNFSVKINGCLQQGLDNFCTSVKDFVKRMYPHFSWSSEEMLVIDGIQAKKIIFEFEPPNDPRKVKYIYLVFVEGRVGWTIEFYLANVDFNLYLKTVNTIIDSFHLHDVSRGEKAITNILDPIKEKGVEIHENNLKAQRKNLQNEIRRWAIGLVIIGVISIFIPIFSKVWGFILIGMGIIELIFPRRAMYVVNGILLIIIGLWNALPSMANGEYLWGMYGVAQFGWGIQQFVKYNEKE